MTPSASTLVSLAASLLASVGFVGSADAQSAACGLPLAALDSAPQAGPAPSEVGADAATTGLTRIASRVTDPRATMAAMREAR